MYIDPIRGWKYSSVGQYMEDLTDFVWHEWRGPHEDFPSLYDFLGLSGEQEVTEWVRDAKVPYRIQYLWEHNEY